MLKKNCQKKFKKSIDKEISLWYIKWAACKKKSKFKLLKKSYNCWIDNASDVKIMSKKMSKKIKKSIDIKKKIWYIISAACKKTANDLWKLSETSILRDS